MKFKSINRLLKKKLVNNICFINIVPPILFHCVCLIFWIILKSSPSISVTLIELLFNIIFIPIYLIIINTLNRLKTKRTLFLFNTLLMELSIILGNLFHYFNWGVTTGLLLIPDNETVMILKASIKIGSIIVLLAGVCIQIFLVLKIKYF